MQGKELTLKSEKETENLAIKIAAQIKKGSIITFRGGLGVGKTLYAAI